MKVSVCISTYNQKAYIGQAIRSALEQVTRFEYEILVGDDASTDGTQAIIEEWAARYPGKVIPVLHEKNLGGFGKYNTLSLLKQARGAYIAQMDGDDYFIHSQKLQKLADFLDAHPAFSACFHNARILWEGIERPSELVNPPDQKPVITTADLVGTDEVWFIATSGIMWRAEAHQYFPKWFFESKSGDIPRYVLLAKWGPIGYLPEVMSVYRKHYRGMSFTDHRDTADFVGNRIGMLQGIDRELGHAHHNLMRHAIGKYYLLLAGTHEHRRNPFTRAAYALRSLYLTRPNPPERRREIVRDYVVPKPLLNLFSKLKWGLEKARQRP